MSSLTSTLKLLEEKLEDLQRDTKFCVNNYDYHHKNNEHEIMQNLQAILRQSLQEGEQFLSNMDHMRSSINVARKKCREVNELLVDLDIKCQTFDKVNNCTSGSQSFHEETGDLGEHKENLI